MTTTNPGTARERRHFLCAAIASVAAGLMASCSFQGPSPSVVRAPDNPASRAYRREVASHLYSRNSDRIYKGMLPAMLYAIGVLQVDLDRRGQVTRTRWLRAPGHAPEVVAEIERIVRRAAPYPAPGSAVTYTDTWLWDQSGRFQLDTLTEGQR